MRVYFLLITFLLLLFPPEVSAHILKTIGPIGVIYHLEPDHSPLVGEPASISFEFKDKNNKLTPENCFCEVEISKGGKVFHTEKLFQKTQTDSLTNQFFQFSFPEKGVYTVSVKGESKSGEFEKFKIDYDQRVDRVVGETDGRDLRTYGLLILGGILLFLVLAKLKSR